MIKQYSKETELFNDLAELCTTPGYAHVIAYFCVQANWGFYSSELNPENMEEFFANENLLRTELTTLIGLMCKKNIDLSLPSLEEMQNLIDLTSSLLDNLHHLIWNENPKSGRIREPIIYGPESAYSFQYREFSKKKYVNDGEKINILIGASLEDIYAVLNSIIKFQTTRMPAHFRELQDEFRINNNLEQLTYLPGFKFSLVDITILSGLPKTIVHNVINAFTLPPSDFNKKFTMISELNTSKVYPIIYLGDDNYILYNHYSLYEAFYENPFFWLIHDESYRPIAEKNRCNFLEEFTKEKLKLVFGNDAVFSNVELIHKTRPKVEKKSEIDVLVIFATKALIFQAKSKKLTIEARKGNEALLGDDFKKSVQNAYNQGLICAEHLLNKNYELKNINLSPIDFTEIYIIPIISENYPSLASQCRQFLKYETTKKIKPPFVMDIFLLDVMTEMLQTPLYFLSYLNRRVDYMDDILIITSHEITTLAYHLKYNLWFNKANSIVLEDDLSTELDTAMTVRREKLPGNSTPIGILTFYKDTTIGKIISQISRINDSTIIHFGFLILRLSQDTMMDLSNMIDQTILKTRIDGFNHDFSTFIPLDNTGVTFHCNARSTSIMESKLYAHCEVRKYEKKASRWFGIYLDVLTKSIKSVIELDFDWEFSQEMDEIVKDFTKNSKGTIVNNINKVGRNELCPCNSRLKYKKCCYLRLYLT